jgi:hypothetical protein
MNKRRIAMMKKNYKMKRTISMKQFITEFGEGLSKHMKQRLSELGERCLLNRRDESHILDLRHIEHIKYECSCSAEGEEPMAKKEYAFGQFVVQEGALYFSQSSVENDDIMQISTVNEIYNSLNTEEIEIDEIKVKRIDDSNIDFVIDSILKVCPEVSAEHMAIIAKYIAIDSRK